MPVGDGGNNREVMEGRVPIPDPTVLTTQALLREVAAMRELLELRIQAEQGIRDARLDQVERQFELVDTARNAQFGRLEKYAEDLCATLDKVFEEKIQVIAIQLELVERGRVEQKGDTKAAVDAALTAQKEAVREQTAASERAIAKSEAATSKQLDQLSLTFSTATDGLRRELGDMKERVGAVENVKLGAKESRTGLYAAIGALATLLFLGMAVVAFVASGP